MRVRFLPLAEEEARQATTYYREQSRQVADRFLEDVTKAIGLLQQFPRLGAPIGNNARRLMLKTFPYQLIYRVEGGEIRVYAVAHLKRRPGYWHQRLRD
jgi:plasmid stabilization system protein ParE